MPEEEKNKKKKEETKHRAKDFMKIRTDASLLWEKLTKFKGEISSLAGDLERKDCPNLAEALEGVSKKLEKVIGQIGEVQTLNQQTNLFV